MPDSSSIDSDAFTVGNDGTGGYDGEGGGLDTGDSGGTPGRGGSIGAGGDGDVGAEGSGGIEGLSSKRAAETRQRLASSSGDRSVRFEFSHLTVLEV